VDYEGRPYRSPVLLGIRVDGKDVAWIVDGRFATCARRWRARHADIGNHAEVVLQLLDVAESQGRRIVSWSLHDPLCMAAVLTARDLARLRRVYVNALDIVRPWHRQVYGMVAKEPNSLDYYRRAFELSVPDHFGPVVGKHLASLDLLFDDGLEYGDFNRKQRDLWVAVVRHNRFDLEHTEVIVRQVLRV